jgi:predicted HTH domain antitoxin
MDVKFVVPIGQLPEEHRAEAVRKAREAFALALLRQGDVSAGRAAELLQMDRWQLADLMSAHGVSPFDAAMTREDLEQEIADAVRTS